MALSALNFAAFTVTPNAGGSPASVAMLAYLKTFAFEPQNKQADAGGLADRYPVMLNVKQSQPIDFTAFVPSSGSEPVLTNLDVSLWTLGGTAFLGSVRSGSLEVTTVSRDASGIASAYESPSATRTIVQLKTQKLIVSDVSFVSTLLSGSVSSFDVAAAVTFGGAAFAMPMTIKSARHIVDREELQLEDVVLTPKGAPTGPSDNSLLGNILLGTSQVALAIDTGGGQYSTAESAWALITKLTTRFQDGACLEQSGQFVFQGGAVYATG